MNRYLYVVIIWTIIIFTNSLLPGNVSSVQSSLIVDISKTVFNIVGIELESETLTWIIRKTAHFMQFMILGVFWMLYLKNATLSNLKHKSSVYIIAIATALIDEGIQYFIPERAASLIDVLIDWAGLFTGFLWIHLFIKQKHTQK